MNTRNIIEAFWEAHLAGDHDALKQVISREIEWTVVGRSCPIAKTYHGWEGFMGELLGGLAQAFVPGTLNMKLLGLYVDEAQEVGILHLFETATAAPTGFVVESEIVDVITVKDGKIVAVREIMDLAEPIQAFGFKLGK